MARVFTVTPGSVVTIAGYGEASNTKPAIVPGDVAVGLAVRRGFRLVAEEGELLPTVLPVPPFAPEAEDAEEEPADARPARSTGKPRGRPRKSR